MDIMHYLEVGMLWGTTIVGAASLIVKAITMVTKITPTHADDEAMTKVGQWVGKAQKLLSAIALNPKPPAE